MIAWRIEDIRQFTSKLFVKDTFDRFLVREAEIVTFNAFSIDGRMKKGYFTEEETAEKPVEEYASWELLRPFCFSLIKGKKLPGSFQIVLQPSAEDVKRFLEYSGLRIDPAQIGALYLNIRYDEGELHCISGISLNFFTMDKTVERTWEDALRMFLKRQSIACVEE